MRAELFEMLDQAGFGSNVHQIAADGECRVLRLEDDTGEGFMTMYRIFSGVYLMFNDFHLKTCISEYQNADTVLCIDHCREGRIEHENLMGNRYYMESGDMRIDRRVHHEGQVYLPLSHYHGMTIGFTKDTAQESLAHQMPWLKVDLESLGQKFCPNENEFLLRENKPLNTIFSQLYHAPEEKRIDYYKLKIAELLIVLGTVDTSAIEEKRQYFPTKQTEKIEKIHTLITSRLDKNYTVEELSKIFDIPTATLRKIFKAMYGSPIYQYIKSYRMKAAAAMLIRETDLKISQVAEQFGYDNASKFSAAFRAVMGMSPQEYRSRKSSSV